MLHTTQSRKPPANHTFASTSPMLHDQQRQRTPDTKLVESVWWVNEIERALDKKVPLSTPQLAEVPPLPPFPPSAHTSPAMLDYIHATPEATSNVAPNSFQVPGTGVVRAVDGAEQACYNLSPRPLDHGATPQSACSTPVDTAWPPSHKSGASLSRVKHGIIARSPPLSAICGPVEATTHATVPFPGPHFPSVPGQNSTCPAAMHGSATTRPLDYPIGSEMRLFIPHSGVMRASPLITVPDRSTTQVSGCEFDRSLHASDEMTSQQHYMQQPPNYPSGPLVPTRPFDAQLLSRSLSPRDVRSEGTLYPSQLAAPCQLAPSGIQTKEEQRHA